MKINISVGDRVRVRYGDHAGETATVADITWHINQDGSYARVQVRFNDGQAEDRGMDSLEKAQGESPRAAHTGH